MSSHPRPDSRAKPYAQDGGSRLFVPTSPQDDLAYSDGDVVEHRLLDLVRGATDVSLHSAELAAAITDWPTRYHLGVGRAHLLRPLAHLLGGRTLEVGAGCGALTRYLGELGGDVVAVEGSRRRAEITAARCRDLRNVSVFHDRFERFEPEGRFQAVTLVGVLEWAARTGDGDDGPRRLLAHAASLVDEDGVVILAIENQLGLKYLAGWAEDHVGAAMRGVDDAYAAGEPRTFGLGELTALLQAAGLPSQAVFAPFPDYKFPRVIVSPEGLDHVAWSGDLAALVGATPVADPQAPVLPVFSLERALGLAARNGLLRGLANSFLIVAGRQSVASAAERHVLAWHYSAARRPAASLETRFMRSRKGVRLARRPISGDSAGADAGRVRHRPAEAAFEQGEIWIERLGAILNRPGWTAADVAAWAAPWRDALAREAELHHPSTGAPVPARLVDATPFNMVVSDGERRFFDLEWEPEWRVEFGFALFRGLLWSLARFRSVAAPGPGLPVGVARLVARVAEALGTPLSDADLGRYLDLEADFQHDTTGLDRRATRQNLERLRLWPRLSLESVSSLSADLEAATSQHAAATADRDALRAEAERLRAAFDAATTRYGDEMATQASAHEAAIADLARAHRAALDEHARLHQAALAQQVRSHETALAQQAATHREAVESQAAAHREALETRDAAHRAELQARDATHRQALDQAADAYAGELMALEDERSALAARLADLEAASEEAAAERRALAARLESARAAQAAAVAELRDTARARAALAVQLREARAAEAHLTLKAQALETALGDTGARLRERERTLQRQRRDFEQAAQTLLTRVGGATAPQDGDVVPVPLTMRARRLLGRARVAMRSVARDPVGATRSVIRRRRRPYRLLAARLMRSGLFDPDFYRTQSGVRSHVDVVGRFLAGGDLAGERPHLLFDPAWYRGRYPDVTAQVPPLQHYLKDGGWELRSPHPLFDPRYYLHQWPAGVVRSMTPLSHYVKAGGVAGISPHPLFDSRHYFAQRPDLGPLGVNPLAHYLTDGHAEGLDPHVLFSTRYYAGPSGTLGGLSALEHYVRHGAVEGRSPHPLFDPGYYWEQRPDVRAASDNPLLHYLHFGDREDVNPHPLFDVAFYRSQVQDLDESGTTALEHYLRWGWRDGLRPHPLFDPRDYAHRHPDLRGAEPLTHFVEHGWREGRDPSREFRVRDYLDRHPDVVACGMNPLEHFVRHGSAEGRMVELRAQPRPVRPVSLQVAGQAALGPAILVVSHVSPWPVGAGNEYRLARLLDHLRRQGYRLILVLSPLPGDVLAPGALDHLAAAYGNVVLCDRQGHVEYRFTDQPDVLRELVDDPSALVAPAEPGPDLPYCHDVLVAVVRKLAGAIGPAAVIAEYVFMTRALTVVGDGTMRVVDTIDVFSQKGTNVVAYGIGDDETAAADEARLLARADLVLAIHEHDASTLRRLAPDLEVIVAGVDADARLDTSWPERPVLMLPASGNALNLTGLRDFLKLAWPRVRAAVPDAELRVVGRVGRAVPAGTPGVTVLGHVPDLAIEYAAARVVVNPAVAGTGLKIKSIEALANLRPVVGWPHNRDGLPPVLAAFVDEATDWQDFADLVVARLTAATSPFDEEAIRLVSVALSPATAYGALDARLRRHFGAEGPSDQAS